MRALLPVRAVGEDGRVAGVEDRDLAPAELGAFAAAADQALHPRQQRVRVAALRRHLGVARRERPARLVGGREPAVGLGRPLHRRAHAHPPRDVEVLEHPDLLAVEQHRRAGEREGERVGQPDPVLVAAEHRRQPPPQPAAVELVLGSGPKAANTSARSSSLSLSSVSSSWLRTKFAHCESGGDLRQRAQRPRQRRRLPARERQVHGLVDREAEDHVQLVAVLVAEERALLLGRQVDLAHQDRRAVARPIKRRSSRSSSWGSGIALLRRARRLEQERHRVDAEAGQALLEPVADDLRDLVARRPGWRR